VESPLDEKIIWVGTDDGNLQVTRDGGLTWVNTSKQIAASGVPAQTWVSSIEPSHFSKDVVYATFENHMYGDHKTYAAKTTDGGKTWKAFQSNEFTGFAHRIIEDPVNKDLLFLGTEMGLFSSVDGGANWFRMKNNNIPWYSLVRDLQIHPETNDLIIATHGRGIMIIDDISSMRNLSKEILSKEVHLFETGNITLSTGNFGSGGSPSTGGWVAPNAPSLKPFQYYLKDRLSSGEVKLEIYDNSGKLIQTIPGTNRRGINRVTWNQRIAPPKTASGATKPDNGASLAPQVLPGSYSLKLKIGSKVFEQNFTLLHDAQGSITLKEREEQHAAATALYNMHVKLASIVSAISSKQKEYTGMVEKIKNKKLLDWGKNYLNALETLRAELIPTKQTSMFADEKRLREEITEVYLPLCVNEAGPSNLQLANIKTLNGKVEEAGKKMQEIELQYEQKLKNGLIKEKIMNP
jgi:hypothetical protein